VSTFCARATVVAAAFLLTGCPDRERKEREPEGAKSPILPDESAQPTAPPAVGEAGTDLNQLRSYALAYHPEIVAAQRATLVALARARQAGLFPNPVISYNFDTFYYARGQSNATPNHLAGISQAIPLGNRIEAARREATNNAHLSEAQVALARRELVARVDEGVAHYLKARARAALTRTQNERVQAFERVMRARVAAGTALEADLLATTVNVEQARLEAEASQRTLAAAAVSLRAIIGSDVDVARLETDLPRVAPPLDTAELGRRVREESPSVIVLERQNDTARATLARAEAERWPDITVALAGGYQSGVGGGPQGPTVAGGIAIPLPLFNRNQYAVEAAERDLERLERSLDGARLALTISTAAVARDYENARTRVDAYRDRIVPAAREALSRTEAAFAAGKVRDRDVLLAHQALIHVEEAEVDAREDLALAVAAIERLIASPVPTR
jgi:cobalt-zinc-cadmium efflux system outer membrane protein